MRLFLVNKSNGSFPSLLRGFSFCCGKNGDFIWFCQQNYLIKSKVSSIYIRSVNWGSEIWYCGYGSILTIYFHTNSIDSNDKVKGTRRSCGSNLFNQVISLTRRDKIASFLLSLYRGLTASSGAPVYFYMRGMFTIEPVVMHGQPINIGTRPSTAVVTTMKQGLSTAKLRYGEVGQMSTYVHKLLSYFPLHMLVKMM